MAGETLVLLDEWLRERRANGVGSKTIEQRRRIMGEVLSRCDGPRVDQITRADLAEAFADAFAGMKPSTRNFRLGVVRGFFNWLVATGELERSPALAINRAKQSSRDTGSRSMTLTEARALVSTCGNAYRRAFYLVMLNTGLRQCDVRRLTRARIRERAIWYAAGETKSGNDEWLPLNMEAESVLASINWHVGEDGLLFPSEIHDSSFNRDCANAGIGRTVGPRPLTKHGLRKTFVTQLDEIGAPQAVKVRLARHSNANMLTDMVYTDVRPERLREWIARIGPFGGSGEKSGVDDTSGRGSGYVRGTVIRDADKTRSQAAASVARPGSQSTEPGAAAQGRAMANSAGNGRYIPRVDGSPSTVELSLSDLEVSADGRVVLSREALAAFLRARAGMPSRSDSGGEQ